MRAGVVLLVASVLPSCAQTGASAPSGEARVHVFGAAVAPHRALWMQWGPPRDDLVLVDIGCFVDGVLSDLRSERSRLEELRAQALAQLLDAMRPSLANDDRAIVDVARRLVAEDTSDAAPADVRDEAREVRDAVRGVLRFVPGRPEVDWASEHGKARGAGALDGPSCAALHLRTVLARLDDARRLGWRVAIAAQKDSEASRTLRRLDEAFVVLFGADDAVMPGLIAWSVHEHCPDLSRLEDRRADGRSPWQRLDAATAVRPTSAPVSVRETLLALAAELAGAAADDPFFAPLGPERWRRILADTAATVHVGMRETSHSGVFGGDSGELRSRSCPRIVVEPLPRAWNALRDAVVACDRLRAVFGRADSRNLENVSLVLEALAVQQRGDALPPELAERLVSALPGSSTIHGSTLPVAIDGIEGVLRRAEPVLVRVPVQWKGETKQALAFRTFVEHRDAAGTWSAPPWGVDLASLPK